MLRSFARRTKSQRFFLFFFQAEDGIRYYKVTGVQTCALSDLRRTPSTRCAGYARRCTASRRWRPPAASASMSIATRRSPGWSARWRRGSTRGSSRGRRPADRESGGVGKGEDFGGGRVLKNKKV